MTQFTSKLDFNLTKKRFEMMLKKQNSLLSSIKLGFMLPVLSVITLIYCTQINEQDIASISDNIEYGAQEFDDDSEFMVALNYYHAGPNPVFADTTLYLRRSEINIHPRKYYSGEGKLFTGTQNWFYEKSGDLDQTIEINNGIAITIKRFHSDGSEFLRSEYDGQNGDTTYHRSYQNGELESTSKEWSYQEGSTIFSFAKGSDSDGNSFYSEQEKDLTTAFFMYKLYSNDLLFHHQYEDEELCTMKSYHSNGQLLSEGTVKNNGNQNCWAGEVIRHGLQITYLEDGELINKEIWENGELVEKIK